MSRPLPARIRALLPAEGDISIAELLTALANDPEYAASPATYIDVRQAMSVMARRGLAKITQRGIGGRCARYALGRAPLWQRSEGMTRKERMAQARVLRAEANRLKAERADEIAAARRERERLRQEKRRRAKGGRTMAEFRADQAANRKPKPPRSNRAAPRRFKTEAERQEARREYERNRCRNRTRPGKAKPAMAPKPEPRPKVQPSVFRSIATREARAASEPRSVACAPVPVALPDSSTWAGPIERLPDGAVSKANRLRFDYRRAA